MLTPLPGSADHRDLYLQGKWLDPDMNRYDSEHAVAEHPRMSAAEWKAAYDRAWHLYYSPEHVEVLLRRSRAGGTRTSRLAGAIFTFYGSYRFEGVHPLQSGAFRRKVRRTRRPGTPSLNPLFFYPKRVLEMISTYARGAVYYLWLNRLRRRIERDPDAAAYTDAAIAVAPGSAEIEGGRAVAELPGFDPRKAEDPEWRLAFKKNRARQNEAALERLKRAGGRLPLAVAADVATACDG
jgi:hypothetical protein